ncbi:MAG: family 78 glycoside hydrolase catalytic domain [Clostridia bacterium]|nr:family 78 glycoside hydrolase catalytic domain [Clostridia bacterium]
MFSCKFIAATEKFCSYDEFVSAPYLRKTFDYNKTNKKAVINICGLGFYRLFLNGEEITKGYLAPYQSNPDDVVYYDVYEVTKRLKDGKNAIGVMLGNGFLNGFGGNVWDFEKAAFKSAPKLALSFEVGGKVVFEADESFKTHPSPIIFDDLRAGERYDARLEINGWANADFDDGAWENAIKAKEPNGDKRASTAPTLEVMQYISPKSVKKYKEGYIFDYGTNTTGFAELKLSGAKSGQRIDLTYFEELADDGGMFLKNIMFDKTRQDFGVQHEVYYCKDGAQSYLPSFTWHGYRYIFVEGITEEQLKNMSLITYEIRSSVNRRGGFSCSDKVVNRIAEMVYRSDVTNLFHYPTDCPHREKNGWTADAALSAEQMHLQLDIERVHGEWIENIKRAQRDDGALPGIVPTSGWGFEWGNGPAWDTVLFDLPYFAYKYRGETGMIKSAKEEMIKYIRYISSKRNDDGLIAIGLGDWCQTMTFSGGFFETPLEITDSLVSVEICRKAAKMFALIGMRAYRAECLKLEKELVKAFKNKWITGYKVKAETQTAQCMAIDKGLFPESLKEKAVEELVRRIKRDNWHMNVGVVGGLKLFDVLSENGYADLAYKLIVQPTPPSYGYIEARGSTTLWEDFYDFGPYDSRTYRKESPYGERVQINSLNHHFWGFVYTYFVKYLVGINYNPNFDDPHYVEIKPVFTYNLDYAEAHYDSINGKICVRWERCGGILTVKVTVPNGIRAKLIVGDNEEELSGETVVRYYKDLY